MGKGKERLMVGRKVSVERVSTTADEKLLLVYGQPLSVQFCDVASVHTGEQLIEYDGTDIKAVVLFMN